MCVRVHACRSQKSASSITPQKMATFLLTQALSLGPEAGGLRLGCEATDLQGFPCLSVPPTEITRHYIDQAISPALGKFSKVPQQSA